MGGGGVEECWCKIRIIYLQETFTIIQGYRKVYYAFNKFKHKIIYVIKHYNDNIICSFNHVKSELWFMDITQIYPSSIPTINSSLIYFFTIHVLSFWSSCAKGNLVSGSIPWLGKISILNQICWISYCICWNISVFFQIILHFVHIQNVKIFLSFHSPENRPT